MAEKYGPLLELAMADVRSAKTKKGAVAAAALWSGEQAEKKRLPVVIKMPTVAPEPGEGWKKYKKRVREELLPLRDKVSKLLRADARPLLAGNALQADADPDQLARISELANVAKLELDPLVEVVTMDDSVVDIDLGPFVKRNPKRLGTGVSVAVLDSGIDIEHPFLKVAKSVTTCGEPVEIPGTHGTHCAGSIASQDKVFPGVAPGVTLFNVKVLLADGTGRHTWITQGIDAALDLGAKVLSMSVGFNHLPTWSANGHGWTCTNGHCPLCTAVDNAVIADGAVVIVAAGNEHEFAEALRRSGKPKVFDTELGCPGQAREAITVAAITKQTFKIAPFSSHGPTSYKTAKPDLCAPGVNITSTVPAPRDKNNRPLKDPSRARLFGRKSGTSMATPIVAGAAALIVQQFVDANMAWTSAMVRDELMKKCVKTIKNLKSTQIGAGRLHFGTL